MIAATAYSIRFADSQDDDALSRLTDGSAPLEGRVLIGEIDGAPAAALSMRDGRVVTGSGSTGRLVTTLRMRAGAIRAYEAQPSLRKRLLAAFPAYRGGSAVAPAPVVAWVAREKERLAA
jgi:hypothetical protein